MNQKIISAKGDVFIKAGLPLTQVYDWNEVQALYSKHGFVFIEYEKRFKEEYIWKCYLESKESRVKSIDKPSLDFDGEAFNSMLSNQFSDRESYNKAYWQSFMNNVKWSGYYIPVDEFKYFTNSQLKEEINHGYLLSKHFQADDFLIAIKKDSIEDRYRGVSMAILGIWNYLVFYSNFLFTCWNAENATKYPISTWHSRSVSIRKFYTYLPSRQLSTLLMIAIELGYDDTPSYSNLERLIKYAHPIVRNFIEKYLEDIKNWIQDKEEILFSAEMKDDFIECCHFDKKIITTLEILDNSNYEKVKPFLSFEFRNSILNKSSRNIFSRIRKVFSELSILDILWFDPLNSYIKPHRYQPNLNYFNPFSEIKWYNLEESIIENIDKTFNGIHPNIKSELSESVHKKFASHLINVANTFAPPAFIWKLIEGQTIPNWNIFDNKTAQKHLSAYYKKQESLAAQKRRLKKAILGLESLKTIEEIKTYVSKVEPFFDSFINSNWKLKVDQHSNAVEGLRNYRERRMVELGIKSQEDKVDFRNELWLDEMLQIEEEIRKFIPYVKKAFTAALPIRRTIEFNNTRHVQSGIEFDPNTINDQNKWLRGEVMKTFKTKTKLGEIEQINAFCLDYSGSMKHDRMRNLFKMLYLLVLGLEDRKSYDAFHFFSSNFIEGSNFSEDFTQRSLLFNILSKVSDIKDGKVKYGGYMGTNIGAGVLECHNRIHKFKNEITQKKPNSKFVCSMFVITDGEPSVGIYDLEELNDFIQEKRDDGEIAIKGIYIKSEEDENNFMEDIFGPDEFVETVEFGEAVHKFVNIMTRTYREQRTSQKWKNRKNSITGRN